MKLARWFELPNSDGTKRLKGVFATRIGVSSGMVSEYCAGAAWPSRPIMEAIAIETGGDVMPNDFVQDETVRSLIQREAECAR